MVLVRLVTGCSWEDAEHLCGYQVSDTTVRGRRDEWIAAGVFDRLVDEAVNSYDKIVELDLSEAIDASIHKAPGGGEGTGPSPVDRARPGWKWSIATDYSGIPVGWSTDAANRHDQTLLAQTLESVAQRGLIFDIETVHLDRGYDTSAVRDLLTSYTLADTCIAKRRTTSAPKKKTLAPRGLRWPVERTNAWMANAGAPAAPMVTANGVVPSDSIQVIDETAAPPPPPLEAAEVKV